MTRFRKRRVELCSHVRSDVARLGHRGFRDKHRVYLSKVASHLFVVANEMGGGGRGWKKQNILMTAILIDSHAAHSFCRVGNSYSGQKKQASVN